MKRLRGLFGFCALVCLAVLPLANLHGQSAAQAQQKHSLWKAQVGTNTIYFLGSIHVLTKDAYPLPEVMEAAFRQSSLVVFEADLEEMKSAKFQLQTLALGKLPAGETLQQNVSKDTYGKFEAYCKESGLPAEVFQSMRPWMVAVGLLGIELNKLGIDPEQGVDQHFFQAARRDKKEIMSLETCESQLRLFSDFTKEEQEAMLKETLQEMSTLKKVFGDILAAWKNGSSEKLDQLILEAMRDYPQLYQKLLVDRNQRWFGKLDKLRERGKDVFVVVGAAHLVGKESLLELFRKKGYPVEQQ